jgi:hypothetical protein
MMNEKNFKAEVNKVLNRMSLGNYCTGVDDDVFGNKVVNYEVYDARSNTYTKIRKIIVGAYDEDGNETNGLYGVIEISPEEDAMRYTYHTMENFIKSINGLSDYLDDFSDDDKQFYNDDELDVMIELYDYGSEDSTHQIVAEIIALIINNDEAQAA